MIMMMVWNVALRMFFTYWTLLYVGVPYKEMSDESFSTNAHLSVAMTTTEIDEVQSTGQHTMPLLSHYHLFYFQCAVVVIGVVGAAANALILYAMVASKQHEKHFLIFHQNVFDLCSSLLLVIIYTLKLCDIYLTGTLGYWLCMLLLSENLLWCSLNGSVINLMSLTIERYLKVVHHAWSKKFLRRWVKLLAAAFAWLGAISHNMATVFPTSAVVDGVCYGFMIWSSRVAAVAYGIWNFITFHLIVICILVFCYGRILVVIRRQARVMAGHGGPGSSTGQRPWIKHRSDPLASDPVQRDQNNDPRERFLLHHMDAGQSLVSDSERPS